MDLGLRQSVVLVTGASTGIGKATAVAFGEEGARVALTYRTKEEQARATAEAVRAAGGEALVLQFSLEEPTMAKTVVSAIAERWGTLHVLVNNAIRWPRGFFTIEELPLDELEACLRANLVGTVALVQAALPLMRAAGWGRIVNVSTGLVVDGNPGTTAYVAPKGGIHAFTRTLAKEVAADGILANVLMSGAVASETRQRPAGMLELMAKSATTGRLTRAEEVARAAVFLGSRANGHIHGEAIRADGFFVTPPRVELPRAPRAGD
jgi:3-oxoacyl-[acyl-carrier protein] reductase